MSASQIDTLCYLWATTLCKHGDSPPFKDHCHLYNTIDKTLLGDVKWDSFSIKFSGETPDGLDVPDWMMQEYEVWYQDPQAIVYQLLSNPNFSKEIDLQPFREYLTSSDKCQYHDFMSGDWA
ncbi:hypothetical protein J3R82DRAFT_9990 [Butyriboletus roseoflavus]|nr:hypothetical protein J3R82DRAFT_9990 [Butyriboletus roseoflavus]